MVGLTHAAAAQFESVRSASEIDAAGKTGPGVPASAAADVGSAADGDGRSAQGSGEDIAAGRLIQCPGHSPCRGAVHIQSCGRSADAHHRVELAVEEIKLVGVQRERRVHRHLLGTAGAIEVEHVAVDRHRAVYRGLETVEGERARAGKAAAGKGVRAIEPHHRARRNDERAAADGRVVIEFHHRICAQQIGPSGNVGQPVQRKMCVRAEHHFQCAAELHRRTDARLACHLNAAGIRLEETAGQCRQRGIPAVQLHQPARAQQPRLAEGHGVRVFDLQQAIERIRHAAAGKVQTAEDGQHLTISRCAVEIPRRGRGRLEGHGILAPSRDATVVPQRAVHFHRAVAGENAQSA